MTGCSSQTEANQFTGMVYQGLLLSERKRLRTESIEEHITPNSAPAQWPGNITPVYPSSSLCGGRCKFLGGSDDIFCTFYKELKFLNCCQVRFFVRMHRKQHIGIKMMIELNMKSWGRGRAKQAVCVKAEADGVL